MNPVTIFVTTMQHWVQQVRAVSYDADGSVTEVRSRYYPANSWNPAWRLVKRNGHIGQCAKSKAREIYSTFERFYSDREWENPVPYARYGMEFPARAAFPLVVEDAQTRAEKREQFWGRLNALSEHSATNDYDDTVKHMLRANTDTGSLAEGVMRQILASQARGFFTESTAIY